MAKSIIKEIFIMLLLCVAIVLILGILFYDYIPTNRVIPTREAYITPEDVRTEISEQITELEKTEVSYEITDSDLNLYKQTSSYKPGKSDPFSLKEEVPPTDNNDETNKSEDNKKEENNKEENEKPKKEVNNESKDTTSGKNSTGTFFNDEGIK